MHRIKNIYTITVDKEQIELIVNALFTYQYTTGTVLSYDESFRQAELIDSITSQIPDEVYYQMNC